jgi:hypothetical protein
MAVGSGKYNMLTYILTIVSLRRAALALRARPFGMPESGEKLDSDPTYAIRVRILESSSHPLDKSVRRKNLHEREHVCHYSKSLIGVVGRLAV